ncbi:hypothetical protein [Motilimonas cestriensis]|uniref:hypothetical protein n=1 Tax=Motilimonas cestriensis TaxID=2742685 RepID=UPI003DA3827E
MKQNNEPPMDRDALLRQAQQALADSAATDAPMDTNPSLLVKAIAAIFWLLAKIRFVVLRPFVWFGYVFSGRNPVFRFLKKAGVWLAFEPDKQKPDEVNFSARRLGINGSWLSAVLLAIYFSITAAYFYGTQFEELVYTTGKQEIEAGEQYQFTGCTSLPCSTQADNGKYYKIEASHFLPALYYPEEDVFANIPQQDGACLAKGYGFYFRNLRSLYKYFQWYQKVYDVSCRSYTEAEKQLAIGTGQISAVSE